jgi:hypothetical protein
MKKLSLILLGFLIISAAYSNSNLQAKKGRTVVTHEQWYWGLPVICTTAGDIDNPYDQLCACSEPLNATIRTHYSKDGDIVWKHITFSGTMESMYTGEVFNIPNYTMKWYYTDGVHTSWDLHFVCKGKDGSMYIGAGKLDILTGEATSLRAKCK